MSERQGLATVSEATAYLRLGKSRIYEMCQKGELEHVRLGSAVRIPWQALEELLTRCTVPMRQAQANGGAA
jgi:excisionase family DNA binding protein